MRYLVTGCAGFIASKVCALLREQGAEVVGMDSLNDAYDVRLKHWRLAHLLGRKLNASTDHRLKLKAGARLRSKDGLFTFIKGDTADQGDVRKAFTLGRFDAVLNLAARAGVPASFDDPAGFFRSNAEGVANVLDAMVRHGVAVHVLASTSSVYAPATDATPRRSKESDRTDHPRSPYAASKKAAELLCHAYAVRKDRPVSTTVVRYFTVYGPAGRPDMSVFRFIEACLRGTDVPVTGDGRQSRDFTYVDDVARGTILAAKGGNGFRVINLGGGESPTTINGLIGLIQSTTGRKLRRRKAAPALGDVSTTKADITKARRELGWKPVTDLAEGIRRTTAWHEEHRAFAKRVSLFGKPTASGRKA